MKNNYFFIWVTFVFTFCTIATASEEWGEPKRDKESIKIYTRKTTYINFEEFKGVTELKTSLNSLVGLLEDTDACALWVYKCISEKTLRVVSPNEKYNYSVSEGYPFDNRDSIVNIVRTQDAESKTIIYQRTGIPDYIPIQPHLVRVPIVKGSWVLKPEQCGMVSVTFQTLSDPGGYVPSMLANYASVDTPYYTLLNLRKEVMKPKYQNTKNLVDEFGYYCQSPK